MQSSLRISIYMGYRTPTSDFRSLTQASPWRMALQAMTRESHVCQPLCWEMFAVKLEFSFHYYIPKSP